jgi:hypothetical protein
LIHETLISNYQRQRARAEGLIPVPWLKGGCGGRWGDYVRLGTTMDDAVGEAYDKVPATYDAIGVFGNILP